MSVKPTDIRFYGSANMPDADSLTTGGAVDFTKKILFTDISPSGLMDYVSSNASDTATTITVTGRDATGSAKVEVKTLNGTTLVAGTQTYERLLKALQGGTAPLGNIAALSHTPVISGHTMQAGSANGDAGINPALCKLQAGDGALVAIGNIIRVKNNTPSGVQFQLKEIMATTGYGTDVVAVDSDWSIVPDATTTYDLHEGMLFNKGPGIIRIAEIRRPFYNASSDVAGGVSKSYYEKIFAVNNNTVTTHSGAQISKQADPSIGTLNFALTNVLNDTGTVANRQTLPVSGITAFSSGTFPQTINVSSPQELPPGAVPNAVGAQGIWLQFVVAAGTAPVKTSFTIREFGLTT